jgi:N-acetyl-anhydromuramyl-L-alanine amidase AmpD
MISPDATILAKNFQVDRRDPKHGFAAVRLVVLHTTENPCAPGVARAVARYFAGPGAPEASAHYVVGPDELILCVPEASTAWHAPPANFYSIGVEQTGRAAFTPDDWQSASAQAMLARSAALVADLCDRYGLPVVFVDAAGLAREDAGITTHVEVSKAFRVSDHTDPGPSFPMDDFLAAVAAARTRPLQ